MVHVCPTMTDAMGRVTRYTDYDAAGRLLRKVGPNGLVTRYTYHPGGWLLAETVGEDADAATTGYDYDPAGNLIRITLPTGEFTAFVYDAASRLTEIYDNQGNWIFIDHAHDGLGKREVIEIQDPWGSMRFTLTRWYNDRDRISRIVDGAGRETQYRYDEQGNLTKVIDGNGQETVYRYDALNRPYEMTDRALGVTQFGYDALDQLRSVTDPINNMTTYDIDGLGDEYATISPDTGTTTYSHDDAGNVIGMTDAKAQVFSYSYDALNRLSHVDAPGTAHDVSNTYDTCSFGKGHLCEVQRDRATVSYTYTQRGQVDTLTQTVDTWEFSPGLDVAVSTLSYEYDASGRVERITYPSGAEVVYHYNTVGRISGVDLIVDSTTTHLMSNVQYLPFGPMSVAYRGNGRNISAAYDPSYQFTSIGDQVFLEVVNIRDGNANPQWYLHTFMGTRTMTYDNLDRLDTVTGGTANLDLDYEYDAVGNRTELLDTTTTIFSYEPISNRLVGIDSDPVGVDDNGNMTLLHGVTLEYTTDNRLAAVVDRLYAMYDGLGQRVIKETTVPGLYSTWRRSKAFVYDKDGQLIAETGPEGLVTREYIYLDGKLIALLDRKATSNEPFLNADFDRDGAITTRDYMEWYLLHASDPAYDVTGDGLITKADGNLLYDCAYQNNCVAATFGRELLYVSADNLGTPYALSDENGTIVWRATYDPFGLAAISDDPDGDGNAVTFNVRFPGQYYDEESGLHYNYFRDYDPSTGRYIQSDPIGLAGGLNTYAYVENNPLSYVDPFGPFGSGPAVGLGTAFARPTPTVRVVRRFKWI